MMAEEVVEEKEPEPTVVEKQFRKEGDVVEEMTEEWSPTSIEVREEQIKQYKARIVVLEKEIEKIKELE